MNGAKLIAWVGLGIGLAAGFLGSPAGLYDAFAWYDEVVHAFTAAAVALVVSIYLVRWLFSELPGRPWLRIGVVASVALSIGVAWELGEWLADLAFSTEAVGGTRNTMTDLFADVAGALGGAILGLRLFPDRVRARRSGKRPLAAPRLSEAGAGFPRPR